MYDLDGKIPILLKIGVTSYEVRHRMEGYAHLPFKFKIIRELKTANASKLERKIIINFHKYAIKSAMTFKKKCRKREWFIYSYYLENKIKKMMHYYKRNNNG